MIWFLFGSRYLHISTVVKGQLPSSSPVDWSTSEHPVTCFPSRQVLLLLYNWTFPVLASPTSLEGPLGRGSHLSPGGPRCLGSRGHVSLVHELTLGVQGCPGKNSKAYIYANSRTKTPLPCSTQNSYLSERRYVTPT